MGKYFPKMNMVSHSKSDLNKSCLDSPFSTPLCRSQILNIKDLRQSDTGNYTCEVSNSFGSINATYVLIVTGRLSEHFQHFLCEVMRVFRRETTVFW